MDDTGTIEIVIDHHAQEAASLWVVREVAVQGAQYALADLELLDSRIEAHFDGLRIAGEEGWSACSRMLQTVDPGSVFAATVCALERNSSAAFAKIYAVVQEIGDEAEGECISALGWIAADSFDQWVVQSTSRPYMRPTVAGLAIRRQFAARNDMATAHTEDVQTKARALRAVGECKQRSQWTYLRAHVQSDDEKCRFWAIWSTILLGDTAVAEILKSFVNFNTSFAHRAIQLAPRVLEPANAREWLLSLAQDDGTRRFALIGCGVTGDPVYIPTLISQMSIPEHARVAGEAFSMITGVDLAYEDLDTDWPEGFEAGPTEDPADENVDLDPDEDLPWPNQELIQKWWNEHAGAYKPGVRHLCGQPISRENCRRVLIEGFQRQRIAAALELALLNPDEPLFEWRAPGWRQQEWLGLRKPRPRAGAAASLKA